jgi:BirA family biotin operon repressor/biotin-[acetyl-CoA-carboxylase] ligase
MDEVESRARLGAPEGLVVVADHQTAGRGRAGRTWAASPGSGLLCSILLRPPLSPDRLSTLPLIAGIAVAEAIEDCAPVDCRLKWPNDVLIGGCKVAGVLLKATVAGGAVEWVVLGIGVNLTGEGEAVPPGATTIRMASGKTVDWSRLMERLLPRLQSHYDRFVLAGGRPDLSPWLARAALLNERVTVVDAGTPATGRFVGVDSDGALLLDEGGAIKRVVAGDLSRGTVAG